VSASLRLPVVLLRLVRDRGTSYASHPLAVAEPFPSAVSVVLNARAGTERIPADLAAAGSALAQAITDTLRMAGYDVLLATHHRRECRSVGRGGEP